MRTMFTVALTRLGWNLVRKAVSQTILPGGTVSLTKHSRNSSTEASRPETPYFTRGAKFKMVPRPDPVVWSDSSGKWSPGPLSQEQLEDYNQNGFLMLEGLFSQEEVRKLIEIADRLRDEYEEEIMRKGDIRVTEASKMVTEASGDRVRSLFEIHKGAFRHLGEDVRLVRRCRQILSDNVYIHQSRVNYQSAFLGRGFEWHTDFETFHAEDGMPKPRALSCVVYLSDTQPQNGALMVVPRSHMTYISCAGETPDNHWSLSLQKQIAGMPDHHSITTLAEKYGITCCTARAGSVLMFDSNLLHGSHSNISPWGRINVFMVYNSIKNKPGDPIYTNTPRPEHVAARDPAWVKPIRVEE